MSIQYFAADYAWGINPVVEPLVVQSGSNAAGVSGTLVVAKPSVTLGFGRIVNPIFNTNASVNIDGDTGVTVSAVSTAYPNGDTSVTLTTPTHAHGKGSLMSSGTVGLQEAINDAIARTNGGLVIVDAYWTLLGGTTAMIAAATVTAGVSLMDIRNAAGTSLANPTALTTNGAIPVTASAVFSITKAGVLADTLAATSTNGIVLTVSSATAYAHTVTATGLYVGAAGVNLATFAAYPGCYMTVQSISSKWLVLASAGVTFS